MAMAGEETIAGRLAEIRERIARAEAASGRPAGSVSLVAVSKNFPPEAVAEAAAAGQALFGENRVQEAAGKIPALPPELSWHLIGHLQSNKARKALPLFGMIESVDSLDLARHLDRVAGDLGLAPRILLQVNVADDGAKFGFSVSTVRESMPELLGLRHLRVTGLMTIPAFTDDPAEARPAFARLRETRDALASECGATLPELSMGMSHDFEIAVEEGATLVRVGTAIFGGRGQAVPQK